MRRLYSAAFYCALPVVFARLLWRSIRAPDYRKRLSERLGYYRNLHRRSVVWFHAVSVGEAEALFPLVKRMRARFPEQNVLVTTTTPTGSARVRDVLGECVDHVYLPYDVPGAVDRFLLAFEPVLAVIMETEIWPNLFAACTERGIPLYLVNARLSSRSARGYLKIARLVRPVLTRITRIAAQTQEDCQRFVQIGADAEKVERVGNIKFDMEMASGLIDGGERLKAEWFSGRFVWIIASSHEREESLFLDLYRDLQTAIPDLLLLLVPRHPERFAAVEKLCRQARLNVVTRASGSPCSRHTDVFLLNKMGELKQFYAAADVAFVGGSMVPAGGHNILEPAALGVPVLFGPYMNNFKEIASNIVARRAAIQCRDQQQIRAAVLELFQRPEWRKELAVRGRTFVEQNRGALERTVQILSDALDYRLRSI